MSYPKMIGCCCRWEAGDGCDCPCHDERDEDFADDCDQPGVAPCGCLTDAPCCMAVADDPACDLPGAWCGVCGHQPACHQPIGLYGDVQGSGTDPDTV